MIDPANNGPEVAHQTSIPVPPEQQTEQAVLALITQFGNGLEQQPLDAVIGACEVLSTTVYHPSHQVVDAALDFFQRVTDSSGEASAHHAVLYGMDLAADRPDRYGLDRVSEIVHLLQDGYWGGAGLPRDHILMKTVREQVLGLPPYEDTQPEEAAQPTAVQQQAWKLRAKLFFKTNDYEAERARKLEEAKAALGTAKTPNERIFNLIQALSAENDMNSRSRFFLGALELAETTAERRHVFAAMVCIEPAQKALEETWFNHHIRYPTDLPGGGDKAVQVLDEHEPGDHREAILEYLTKIDDTVRPVVAAVRSYQDTLSQVGGTARDTFFTALK